MIARLYSAALVGVEGVEVEVEVDVQAGSKMTAIVGLPDTAIKESTQRVNAAILNSGFASWEGLTVVNLAPADLRKQGPSFDLPIALGVLAATEGISALKEEWFVVGELALDGSVRAVRGMISLILEAKQKGRKKMLIPWENAREAALISGVEVYPVGSLREAWALWAEGKAQEPFVLEASEAFSPTLAYEVDFEEIKGQAFARRALEIAAAGGHNILLCGSPGAGKSMFAQRLPTILPELTEQEALETSKIYSVCGLLEKGVALSSARPFRAPHHTISDAGLMGGGAIINPGEISLSHNGVLFLDELPEFKRQTLETLRQPLEAGFIVLSRASGTVRFPCQFMLMAAMNPCPCGFLGDPKRKCSCNFAQIAQYRRRISGPLLDRFDLLIEVPPVDLKSLLQAQGGESSASIRARVVRARQRQKKRFEGHALPQGGSNARLSGKMIKEYCALSPDCLRIMHEAIENMSLSARGHDRILKVARTIADLAESELILPEHLYEAIQLRQFLFTT